MCRGAIVLMTALMTLSCGGSSSVGSSSSPSASAAPATSPSASPSIAPLTGVYGLILSAGTLQLIKPDATIKATAPVASTSVRYCSAQQDGVNAQAPVSATNDQVYFRDGDTKIRMVVPPASAVDVTTVPGGPNTISFFSVSPDDQRIAVLVEDLSASATISQRLYVEDLVGGGHHVDLYTTTIAKGKNGTTLWPMGWHQGAIVFAVVPACAFEPGGLQPTEWHVANAANANRVATILGTNCVLSAWPSAAGVGCMNAQGATTLYDWAGKVVSVTGPGTSDAGSATGLSPAGRSIFFSKSGVGVPTPTTRVAQLGPGPYSTIQGHAACGWIDEDHLLAGDAVIQFPAETGGNVQVTATAATLDASGQCAGRFPGGL